MMELICFENEPGANTYSYEDPGMVLANERVLQNLLTIEEKYTVSSSYFKCFQTDLKPDMRKIVAMWMLEVCEVEMCQQDVFPLAMSCLDRFLSVVRIKKSQLQLLGTVCLFLASKLRQTRPLDAEKLCRYTDNSITLEELMEWELLVLGKLKWDLSAITPHDFVDHMIQRLLPLHPYSQRRLIRSHAQTFITLCATEVEFSMHPPSMIAAASISSAIFGLLRPNWSAQRDILERLHEITGIEVDCLRSCTEQIEQMIARSKLEAASQQSIPVPTQTSSHSSGDYMHKLAASSASMEMEASQPETPTDVQDVMF